MRATGHQDDDDAILLSGSGSRLRFVPGEFPLKISSITGDFRLSQRLAVAVVDATAGVADTGATAEDTQVDTEAMEWAAWATAEWAAMAVWEAIPTMATARSDQKHCLCLCVNMSE